MEGGNKELIVSNPLVAAYFKQQFALYDKEQSESIPIGELGNCLRMCGLNPTEGDIELAKQNVDPEGTGLCTYDAFLESAVFNCVAQFQTIETLRDAFRAFDDKGVQFISANEFRWIMCSMGDKLTDAEMNELMEEAKAKQCLDTDGNIQYEDFCNLMMPDFMKDLA